MYASTGSSALWLAETTCSSCSFSPVCFSLSKAVQNDKLIRDPESIELGTDWYQKTHSPMSVVCCALSRQNQKVLLNNSEMKNTVFEFQNRALGFYLQSLLCQVFFFCVSTKSSLNWKKIKKLEKISGSK